MFAPASGHTFFVFSGRDVYKTGVRRPAEPYDKRAALEVFMFRIHEQDALVPERSPLYREIAHRVGEPQ